MSGKRLERKQQRLDRCRSDKQLRDRYRDKRDARVQKKISIGVDIAILEGEITSEENELTNILRRIQRISTSGPACVIGGIARRDPTACVEMLVDLSGSEAAYNANISRLKRSLRDKQYQLNEIENAIALDEQVIDRASEDLNRNNCFDIGVF